MKLNMFENIGWQICKHLFKQENYVDLRESGPISLAVYVIFDLITPTREVITQLNAL